MSIHPRRVLPPLYLANAAFSLITVAFADGHIQSSVVVALIGASVGFATVSRNVEHPLALVAAGWMLAANVLTVF
ncbi:MAG: hypothetical protein WCF85_15530 [Rhodospirillaceae bacterium]